MAPSADPTLVEWYRHPGFAKPFSTRPDTTLEEVLRQLEERYRKRQAAIDAADRRQPLKE